MSHPERSAAKSKDPVIVLVTPLEPTRGPSTSLGMTA